MAKAESHPDVKPDKITDYVIDGQRVVVAKKRGRPKTIRNPLFTPAETKIEACTLYTIIGDIDKVSSLTKVDPAQIRQWKEEEWWTALQKKIMMEQSDKLLGKINDSLDKAMNMLEDRVQKGDVVLVPAKYSKDGCLLEAEHFKHVPLKGRDLSQIFSHLTHQRNLMNGDPTQITSPTSMEKRLEDLKAKFATLTKGTILDGECKEIK